MKNLFLIYILACMTSLFIFTSCEENADQAIKAQPDTTKEITTRTIEDCDDCPDTPEHCCCAIDHLDGDPMQLLFCGIYPMGSGSICSPYTPDSPCGTISGTSSVITLPVSSSQLFCVPVGGSFSITNLNIIDAAKLRVRCKVNEVNPPPGIQFNMATNPYYFYTGDCDIQPCDP